MCWGKNRGLKFIFCLLGYRNFFTIHQFFYELLKSNASEIAVRIFDSGHGRASRLNLIFLSRQLYPHLITIILLDYFMNFYRQ